MTDKIEVDREEIEQLLETVQGGERDAKALALRFGDLVTAVTAKLVPPQEPPPDGGEPEPPEPPADLIGEWSDVVAPVRLADGALKDALTFTGVCKVAASGNYEKMIGAAATGATYGGLCLGFTKKPEVEFWVEDASTHQMRQGIVGAPAGLRVGFAVRISDTAISGAVDDVVQAVDLPNGYMKPDGETWLGKGVYKGEWKDELQTGVLVKLRPYRTALTDEQIAADIAGWDAAGLIDHPAPPDGGNGDVPQPPVNGTTPPSPPPADADVKILVGKDRRQKWIGLGRGLGSPRNANGMLSLYQKYKEQAFAELNAQVIRVISPQASDFISSYGPIVKYCQTQGVDTAVATGTYTPNSEDSARALARGVDLAIRAGFPIKFVSPRNEPDGAGGGYPRTRDDALPGIFRVIRSELDKLGQKDVQIIGQEWAHAGQTNEARHEFDLLKRAGLAGTVVRYGAGHLYGDGPDETEYDEAWMTVPGSGIFSMETGYMSANTAARVISGMNNGTVTEVLHQSISKTPGDTDLRQKLIANDGKRLLQQYQMQIVGKAMLRDSVFRLCLSDKAGRMVRKGTKSAPITAACAKRPDGKWVILLASQTGAQKVGFSIAELGGKDGTWAARKCTSGGAISEPPAVQMKNGALAVQVGAGETWSLVGG